MPVPTRVLRASWSSTLFLPKSSLPARALPADQPRYLKQCTDDLYQRQRSNDLLVNCNTFILHDGPPYANGSLHVGHALNKILKDIICRFQVSQGKMVDYVPGWDCHGLPIELKALQQNKSLDSVGYNAQLSAVAVRGVARELAGRAVKTQKKGFKEWGVMADWDHAWKTMDKGFEIKQLGVFREMVDKGLIYRRYKPVYWSPSSRTALAEAELEYKNDHVSTAAYIKLPIATLPTALTDDPSVDVKKLGAVIWTTTPWTIPANRAIAVRSDFEYAIVESPTYGQLLIAKSRVLTVENACKETFKTVVELIYGSDLIGASYRNPFHGSSSSPQRIIHADFVSADSGSGLVHLAPGHGMDDYEVCLKERVDAFAPLDDEGRFTRLAAPNHPDLLTGKEVLKDGYQAVLKYLANGGFVLASHKYRHKYPYDWRSKQPVIVRATEQWFADLGEIREAALQSLKGVTFIPETGRERLESFVKTRSEWCISRQRAWGIPIPALYDTRSGKALLTKESVTHIISVVEARGIDAWWTDAELDPEWTPPRLRERSDKTTYRRGKDTMDVWFDSGTSWTQIKSPKDSQSGHFADVYLEGTDQHRGWFQSSLLTHVAHQIASGVDKNSVKAPFKTLITHGFTLDQHGRKMSKSLGNVISPDEIMSGTLLPPMKRKKVNGEVITDSKPAYDGMGPDALRLWVASSDYTKDVVIGQPVLKAINNNLSKYRITFKLLLGLLKGYDPSGREHYWKRLHQIDQMVLWDLRVAIQKVNISYEDFEFHKAIQAINQFFNHDFSAVYMESIKDRLYADAAESESRETARSTLFYIFEHLTVMLGPVTPLLVEEVWAYTPKQLREHINYPLRRARHSRLDMLPMFSFNVPKYDPSDTPFLSQANEAVKYAQEVARSDKKMGSSLQSSVVLAVEEGATASDNQLLDIFQGYRAMLESLFVVSRLDVCAAGSVPAAVAEAEWTYRVPFEVYGLKATALVYAPQKEKCARCWKYTASVEVEKGTMLCGRCVSIVHGLRDQVPELFENKATWDVVAGAAAQLQSGGDARSST
ncbi:MAG: isoleucyl-tRNA synthetase [Lasallia pustulata]|uniref:Isoleucine--tRNA ligase, mitochondrial n=1 Tax=Lasallia pustulata TaxID=136370 RepID=A0A5M8PPB5_9LECA|nr:MAG: isoleucyl-tRNA synthetase [Lasallia pustulata]